MLLQKLKGTLAVDAVAALKEFDFSSVFQTQLRIKPARLRVFMADPGINADAVKVAPFHHEGPGQYQVGHFGVIKSMAQIPVRHLPFDAAHEAKSFVCGRHLMRPLVEITGADRQTILLQNGRHAHGRFSAVAQTIKGDAVTRHIRERFQPT